MYGLILFNVLIYLYQEIYFSLWSPGDTVWKGCQLKAPLLKICNFSICPQGPIIELREKEIYTGERKPDQGLYYTQWISVHVLV